MISRTKATFLSLIVSSLLLTWSLIFRDYIKEKLGLFNIFGVETDLFLLIIIGVVIAIISYFGVVKTKWK